MQRLKLFVTLFFILFTALAFFGQRWLTTASANKNAAGSQTIAAPAGVAASDGDYIDKIGVMWNAVRGAAVYRVFRSSVNDPASAQEVGATAAFYFFDASAAAGQTYFYWVRAENGSANSAFSSSDQGLRAVGEFRPGFFSPLSPPPVPSGNAVTAAKAYLGKALFWDEQLSSTKTVSCGTCHRPAAGGSDPRTIVGSARATNPGFDNVFNTADDIFGSPGVPQNNSDGTYSHSNLYGFGEQVTPRKAPSYLNSGFAFAGLFWDGRAPNAFRDPLTGSVLLSDWAALESQSLFPPLSDVEMGHAGRTLGEITQELSSAKPLALATKIPNNLQTWINGRSYAELFEEAFGTPEVTPARIALAIAAHERTLFSDRSPLDRWGASIAQLTPEEDRGRDIFVQVNCSFCHGGPLLSDHNFHNIGVRSPLEDTGREGVTGRSQDRARFKTPSLRNLELRAPYMHNGRFQTIEEVVEFYNRGGDFDAPNKDVRVRPLNLTAQQKADLVAFLKRPMTDLRVKNELPPFDRPQLYTESNRVPTVSGTGRAGAGSFTPEVTAIEPPFLGNPSFTIGVTKALSGAQAILVIDSADPGVGASIPAQGSFARISVDLSGTGGGSGFGSVSLPIPNNPALVGQTFYGRWYVTDAEALNGFSISKVFSFTVFGAATAVARKAHADFDGDGRTDVSVFRPESSSWFLLNSSDGSLTAANFGLASDKLVPADFDGDGKTDIAVFRQGVWYIQQSRDGFTAVSFGSPEDRPQPADYDGDGRADPAVFRPSNGTWYIQQSRDGFTAASFGLSIDKPVAADYDGDGRADPAVFRDGIWYLLRSREGFAAVSFGTAEDKPVIGDYDGDGKSDIAVWRPNSGYWYFLRSADDSFGAVNFGSFGDAPSPGDYDGDGKADFAVYRPAQGYWYILESASDSVKAQNWGINQDLSIPAAIVP